MRHFLHPLFSIEFLKQDMVGTSRAAEAHHALIDPVSIMQAGVEYRSGRAVLVTAMNISLPYSSETSYWLSGMTKDDSDA